MEIGRTSVSPWARTIVSRHRRLILAVALGGSFAATAWASSDISQPIWTLDLSSKPEGADTNVAALMPGNDTRANLLLLMDDQRSSSRQTEPAALPIVDWRGFRAAFSSPITDTGGPFGVGEGSRCRSDGAGAKAFSAAVDAVTELPANEGSILKDVRTHLSPDCVRAQGSTGGSSSVLEPDRSLDTALASVTSPMGLVFATYLRGANDFYAGRFEAAAAAFKALRSQSDPWLSDTAAYMVARTAVNAMQADAFEDYGTLKDSLSIDQRAAHDAVADLDTYLQDHPNGLYVGSARGLERRVAWLAGWTEDLAARYAELLRQPPATRGLDDAALAEEIDNKLLPNLRPDMTKDPILLAMLDLRAMRHRDKGEPSLPRLNIEAQRDAFATVPELDAYLVAAAAFFGDGDPKTTIRGLPDETRRRDGNNLWFSGQMLRGLALEKAGDHNARGFWKELLPAARHPLQRGLAELGLAFDDERHYDIEDAFGAGSGLSDPAMRAILLIHDASPTLLRARMDDASASEREREIALFTLLWKDLTHGRYRDFLADVSGVPAEAPKDGSVQIDPLAGKIPTGVFVHGETAGEIGCPALAITAARLAKEPHGSRDRLCFAEWIRSNHFDPEYYAPALTRNDLGFGPSMFPGTVATRSAIYRSVIADEAAPVDDRAYALFRAVKCYEPAGTNGCSGAAATKNERHRWFDTLKSEYPETRWARQVHFWW